MKDAYNIVKIEKLIDELKNLDFIEITEDRGARLVVYYINKAGRGKFSRFLGLGRIFKVKHRLDKNEMWVDFDEGRPTTNLNNFSHITILFDILNKYVVMS